MLSNFLLVFVFFSLSRGNNVKENLQEKNELGAECRDSSTSGRDVSSCPSLKALDFSVDNDGKADQGGEFTHASLAKENFPAASFTVCIAFMVEEWTFETRAVLYQIRKESKGSLWHQLVIKVKETNTVFEVKIGGDRFQATSTNLYFPLRWTKACLALDSNNSELRLVVDGGLLLEQSWNASSKPTKFNLEVGRREMGQIMVEQPGMITDLNVFSQALPVTTMIGYTTAGDKTCGSQGDFLSWNISLKDSEWILHSKARVLELDRGGLKGRVYQIAKVSQIIFFWYVE